MKQTKTLNHSHKEKNYISGSFLSMINSLYSSFLFHYQNREHFSAGPDNLLFDIVPLLIIEQISKTCSFIPAPTPPSLLPRQTAMMLCRDCFHSIVLCHLLYLCTVISFYFLVACIQHFWDQSMRKSTKLRTNQWLHSVFYIVTW